MQWLLFLVLGLCGLSAGLFLQNTGERYHDVVFEYHPNPHVVLVKSRTECYFIRVDAPMLQQIKDTSSRHALEDKIYHQIQGHTGEKMTGVSALAADLHDLRAAYECLGHQVFELTLEEETTTTSTTTSAPTTTTDVPTTTLSGSANIGTSAAPVQNIL